MSADAAALDTVFLRRYQLKSQAVPQSPARRVVARILLAFVAGQITCGVSLAQQAQLSAPVATTQPRATNSQPSHVLPQRLPNTQSPSTPAQATALQPFPTAPLQQASYDASPVLSSVVTAINLDDPAVDGVPHAASRSEEQWDAIQARLESLEQHWDEQQAADAAKREAEKKKSDAAADEKPKKKSWFEKYSFSGYAQIRFNEVVRDKGPADAHYVGDSSIGDDQSFLLRRARLVFSGDVNDHLSVYLQPDFASSVSGSPDANQYVQIRDWYADIYLDKGREHRFRVGQSKLPYGWENLQSSRNRLPLDRNDALNSAVRNERDLGILYYWTPTAVQEFFDSVQDKGLKGSGNYGMLGLGVYNGQGGSLREQNDDLHVISRLTLPHTFDNGQMMELGVQAYAGRYVVLTSPISPLGAGAAVNPQVNPEGVQDRRLALTWVYYAQPIGFQTEWTVGRGPGLSPDQTTINDHSLYGGYAMVNYRHQTDCYGEWWPFLRWNYYDGHYKTERNAPEVQIDEWELGCEWQISDRLEFVGMYTVTDRTNTRALSSANTLSYESFRGDFLRFQLQFNY